MTQGQRAASLANHGPVLLADSESARAVLKVLGIDRFGDSEARSVASRERAHGEGIYLSVFPSSPSRNYVRQEPIKGSCRRPEQLVLLGSHAPESINILNSPWYPSLFKIHP